MSDQELVEIAGEGSHVELSPMGTNAEKLIQLAEQAPKMVEAYKKLRRATLRMMNSQDWVDQDGKPYPMSSGLEKVADPLGISWGFVRPQEKLELDGRYIILTTLWVSSQWGRKIEVVGTRASDDPLYAKRGGVLLPMAEVDEGDIRKASYTNALARGLSIILGLRNMTWEELAEFGITRDKAVIVQRMQAGATTEEKEKQNKVRNYLIEICGGDARAALKKLTEVTSFTGKNGETVPGVKSFSALHGKRLDVTLGKVSDMYKDFTESAAKKETPAETSEENLL